MKYLKYFWIFWKLFQNIWICFWYPPKILAKNIRYPRNNLSPILVHAGYTPTHRFIYIDFTIPIICLYYNTRMKFSKRDYTIILDIINLVIHINFHLWIPTFGTVGLIPNFHLLKSWDFSQNFFIGSAENYPKISFLEVLGLLPHSWFWKSWDWPYTKSTTIDIY